MRRGGNCGATESFDDGEGGHVQNAVITCRTGGQQQRTGIIAGKYRARLQLQVPPGAGEAHGAIRLRLYHDMHPARQLRQRHALLIADEQHRLLPAAEFAPDRRGTTRAATIAKEDRSCRIGDVKKRIIAHTPKESISHASEDPC